MTATDEDPVTLRQAGAEDLNFIYFSWLRDARAADSGPLPDDLWFPAHRELISRALADPAVVVLIAHPVDAADQILGYVVAEPDKVLLWVHVKEKFRGKGLALRLMTAARASTVPASWWTPSASTRLRAPRRSRQLRRRWAAPKSASTATP